MILVLDGACGPGSYTGSMTVGKGLERGAALDAYSRPLSDSSWDGNVFGGANRPRPRAHGRTRPPAKEKAPVSDGLSPGRVPAGSRPVRTHAPFPFDTFTPSTCSTSPRTFGT